LVAIGVALHLEGTACAPEDLPDYVPRW